MIISRTPMRISFFSGGTDYPKWFMKNKGTVISTSINKYNYINVRYLPGLAINTVLDIISEETQNVSQIKHNSVRETLKFLKIKKE